MRKLVLILVLLAATGTARADVGFGLFLGSPTGFDAKIGVGPRAGLDLVLGWDYYDTNNHANYAHLTYLLTPVVGHGSSVLVPLRLGFGLAVFDDYYYDRRFAGGLGAAVRVPVELALRFRSVPLEIYGELALRVDFIRPDDRYNRTYLDGGLGFRVYF